MRITRPNSLQPMVLFVSLWSVLIAGCDDDKNRDEVSPTLITTSPQEDVNRVDTSRNVTATFSEPIAQQSANSTNFTVTREGAVNPVVAERFVSGTTVVLNPTENLLESALYTATLTEGITDLSGNRLEPYSWDFFTDGNGWGPSVLVETNDAGLTEDAVIAGDAAGNAISVWRHHEGNRINLFANRYSVLTGQWSAPVLLEDGDEDVDPPQLSVNSAGDAVVVWAQAGNGETAKVLRASHYSVTSAQWTESPSQISAGSETVANYEIGIDSDGDAIVVWRQSDTQPSGSEISVFANRYTAVNDQWATPEVLQGGGSTEPRVSVNAGGDAIALWKNNDGLSASQYVVDASTGLGVWSAPEFIKLNESPGASDQRIAIDANGNAIAMWRQGTDIFFNRYTAGTTASGAWGTGESVATDIGAGFSGTDTTFTNFLQLAFDASGDAIALWAQEDPADFTNFNIQSKRYSLSSAMWAETETIGTSNNSPPRPNLSVSVSGIAVAVWDHSDSIFTNQYTTRTGEWGTAGQLKSVDFPTKTAKVVMDSDGNAIVVYEELIAVVVEGGPIPRADLKASRFDIRVIAQ